MCSFEWKFQLSPNFIIDKKSRNSGDVNYGPPCTEFEVIEC